jgi:hypothetical protein
MKFFLRTYAWLITLYPRKFRERFGAEMQADFTDLLSDTASERGQVAVAWVALGVYWDVCVHVLRESVHGGEESSVQQRFRFWFVSVFTAVYLLYLIVTFAFLSQPYIYLPEYGYWIIQILPFLFAGLAMGIHARQAGQSWVRASGVAMATLLVLAVIGYGFLELFQRLQLYLSPWFFWSIVYPIFLTTFPYFVVLFLSRRTWTLRGSRTFRTLSAWNSGKVLLIAPFIGITVLVVSVFIPDSFIWFSEDKSQWWRAIAAYLFEQSQVSFSWTPVVALFYGLFLAAFAFAQFDVRTSRLKAVLAVLVIGVVVASSFTLVPRAFIPTDSSYMVATDASGWVLPDYPYAEVFSTEEALAIRESCDVFRYESWHGAGGLSEEMRQDYAILQQQGATSERCRVGERVRVEGDRFYLGITMFNWDEPRQQGGPVYDIYVPTPLFWRVVGYQPEASLVLTLLGVFSIPALAAGALLWRRKRS